MEGCLHKLVLVVAAVASREPLERWVFNVQRDEDADAALAGARCVPCFGKRRTRLPDSSRRGGHGTPAHTRAAHPPLRRARKKLAHK